MGAGERLDEGLVDVRGLVGVLRLRRLRHDLLATAEPPQRDRDGDCDGLAVRAQLGPAGGAGRDGGRGDHSAAC